MVTWKFQGVSIAKKPDHQGLRCRRILAPEFIRVMKSNVLGKVNKIYRPKTFLATDDFSIPKLSQ